MKDNTWITVQSQQLTPLYSIPTVKEFANPFVNSNLSQSKQVWPTVMVHSLPSLVFSLHLHSTFTPLPTPTKSTPQESINHPLQKPSQTSSTASTHHPSSNLGLFRFVFSLGLFSCYFDRISIVSTPLSLSKAPLLPTTKSNFASPMLPQSPKSGLGCSWIQDNSKCPDTIADNGRRQCPLHSVFPTKPAAVSSVEDLFEFICSGPLLNKLGLTTEMVAESINKWLEYGLHLCRLFQLNELYLTIPQKARLYHYYIPVFLWCEQQISLHSSTFKDGEDVTPLVIGFSAPQGCGKTTLVFALDYLFQITGRKSATISIDDFYLTAADQAKLRENNPKNGLLEFRGNAGSHDLSLSVETLTALSKLTKEGMKMKLPRYDKSANSGRGDRADPSTWPEVEGPLTVVLFEGWMLGFRPLPVEAVKAVDPQLEIVNKNLEAYYDAWDKFIKAWIIIKIKDPSCVYQWRLQAEIAMRADGKPGMSDEEVMDFVSRYLPAYKAYLPTLYSEGPNGSDPERLFVVEIDEGRNTILGN